jgi:hypothetical protein
MSTILERQEAVRDEARCQHHIADVLMLHPGGRPPMVATEPERFDDLAEHRPLLELADALVRIGAEALG